MSLPAVDALGDRMNQVERASVLGSTPIVAGIGFIFSRAVAIAIAGASGLSFLWGLVIGLAFATAGVVVLASAETDGDARSLNAHHSKQQVPLATAGGVLLLALLTGIVLGTVL